MWATYILYSQFNNKYYIGYSADDLEEKRDRIIAKEEELLSEGKEATFPQQFLGWIGILGVLGIIIGYELSFAKVKSKFTDKEYFKYDENSRESGRYMFYISIAIVIVFFLLN